MKLLLQITKTLARSLLKPEDRHSQDYSRDREKLVKRGIVSRDLSPPFNEAIPGQNIADMAQYRALEGLAQAAKNWSQLKRNINVDAGKKLMKNLGA